MAAPGKKRAVENEMESLEKQDDDDYDSSEEEEEELDEDLDEDEQFINEVVQVEFEARNAEDPDYHGIVKLLQQLFLKANIDVGELADTIISQNFIGSVMKQAEILEEDESESDDDDMDVFGITTAINITEKQGLASVKQLKSVLLDRCKECGSVEAQAAFQSHLGDDSQHIGLLFNERFINIPPQIALPAFDSLWKEIDRAVGKKMKYKFSHYLLISKTYRLPEANKKKKKKKQQKAQEPTEELTFVNPEERLFYEESSLHFEYNVKSERDTAVGGLWDDEEDEFEPYRTVMLIPSEKIPVVMARMRDMLETQGE